MPQNDKALLMRLKEYASSLSLLAVFVAPCTHCRVIKQSIRHQTTYSEFHLLSLDALIAAKETTGRQRDLKAARLLRAIKEKQNNS